MANRKKHSQKGGGASDYVGLFHASGADPAQLSRFTLNYIDRAPMFHPLETGTIIPTGTSGVIPTGAYYDAIAPLTMQNSVGPPTASYAQLGGGGKNKEKYHKILYVTKKGKKITHPWVAHVCKKADELGIKYNEALKHPDIGKGYVSTTQAKRKSN